MRKARAIAGTASALVLALTVAACGASQDRAKTEPDGYADATEVIVWRNADQIPNVVTFCADGVAWISTLSHNGSGAPALLRYTERDGRCAR